MTSFFTLIFFLISTLLHADIYEQAAFRVQDRAFFVSDANEYISDIEAFRCLHPNSILLKGISLHKKRLKPFNTKGINIKANLNIFEKMVEMVIISRFIQERERSVLSTDFKKKCVKGKVSSDLRSLLRSEIFLADRFKRSGHVLDLSTVKMFIAGLKKKTDYEIFD